MLRTSTKNVAYEVVSCLIEGSFWGVLTDIIWWLKSSQQNCLNDHLSILDSNNEDGIVNKSLNLDNDGAEGDDGESGYISKKTDSRITSLQKEKIHSANTM